MDFYFIFAYILLFYLFCRDPKVPVVSWSNICKCDMFPSIALTAVAECGKQQVRSSMQQGNINNYLSKIKDPFGWMQISNQAI